METIDYEKQAVDFLESTNTTLKAEFKEFGKHFDDDKDSRFIFKITIKRGSRSFSFNFGGSIRDVEDYFKEYLQHSIHNHHREWVKNFHYPAKVLFDEECIKGFKIKPELIKKPSAYDVLTCLTKYDVGSFEDFCSEFGYDVDSRKAEKTYNAVLREWENVQKIWSDEEIEKLQEIQ